MSEQIFSIDNFNTIFENKISRKNSKGIDKVRPTNFNKNRKTEINNIKTKFDNLDYKFIPYLEILKTKGRNKNPRIISAPSVRDKILLTALKEYLHESFPKAVPIKLANQLVRQVKREILSEKYKFFYRTDIKSFYNSIVREKLLKSINKKVDNEKILKVLEDSITNVTLPKDESKKNRENYFEKIGIPQGLPISNILAQIYLFDIDNSFSSKQIKYYRYVDDIIILSKRRPILKRAYLKLKLSKLRLQLNKSKTTSGKLTQTFSFLGYTFKNNILTLNERQISKFISRISGKFTWLKRGFEKIESRPDWLVKNDELFKECFLNELNEKITGAISDNKRYGWLFYFSEIDDLSVLYRTDSIIKSFFANLDEFDNTPPSELKSIVKAYFDIKYNKGGKYVHNYDKLETVAEKRKFLISRGKINPDTAYNKEQIERIYFRYKHKRLALLEKDIGYY